MIAAIWLAIRTSPTLMLILAALAGYGGLKGYGKYQHYSGVKSGELQMADKVEKKANEDAKIADAAAEGVAAGKPGRPDPNRMRK
jgi:hypothetical protein